MKIFTLLSFIFSFQVLAAPIEGGREVAISDMEYVDVVRLGLPNGATCTGTRVSPTQVLTAAHCVASWQNGRLVPVLSVGENLFGVGLVKAIQIHDQYANVLNTKAQTTDKVELQRLRKKETLYDIAFITIAERASQRTLPYPKIISPKTEFSKRGKLELVGYGATKAYWDGHHFNFNDATTRVRVGANHWDRCPISFFDPKVEAMDEFKNEVSEHLRILAKRTHTISASGETIDSHGEALILPGDSGGPAIERDVHGDIVVTAVASNISPFTGDESGQASIEILQDGKVIASHKLSEMPENWGLNMKTNEEFPVIEKILEEKGLLDEQQKLKSGITVNRKYTRVSSGHFSDLSHPDNQKFINKILNGQSD